MERSFNCEMLDFEIPLRPWMIESAHKYWLVAERALDISGEVSSVVAALSLEICLKAHFPEDIIEVSRGGRVDEKYKCVGTLKASERHDLLLLSEKIDPRVRKLLFSSVDLEMLEFFRKTFTEERYFYEAGVRPWHDDSVLNLARDCLARTVFWYKKQGCEDIYIRSLDSDEIYFHRKYYLVY